MFTLTILERELYDERTSMFITVPQKTIQLEHSLVSLSKWEAKWCKPFLSSEQKKWEESVDYVKCMTVTQNVSDETYEGLTRNNIDEVNAYIDAPMTATTFVKEPGSTHREVITAEIIYYWMIALNIPFECQKWHLTRLITLVKVCNEKNKPKKKMRQAEIMRQNMALNKARRERLNTKG